ncbi:MAG TPA: hypothetical protein VK191_14090 [Symbiobacteriaceae bacterium]|nr:hypothetical protein [Symbiobacteriaceae bacterium]
MEPILGPGGRYRLRLELLQEAGNTTYRRRPASECRSQGAEWLCLFGEDGTARLTLGEGGITLHTLGLAQGGPVVLQAEVEAGPEAPGWLPSCATLRLFEGDRQAAAALRDRFIPLPGAVEPEVAGALPLDQLFLAVGRSVARANRALVEIESPGGTALVTTVTVSIAIDSLAVERGRALVKPSTGQAAAPQVTVGNGATMAGGQPSPSRPTPPAPQQPITWPPTAGVAAQTTPQPNGTVRQVTGAEPQTGQSGSTSFVQFTLALAPGASRDP